MLKYMYRSLRNTERSNKGSVLKAVSMRPTLLKHIITVN
jgi:hypothetical protein